MLWLNFRGCGLKSKRDQIYNGSSKFKLPEKYVFMDNAPINVLALRDMGIVTADMFLLNF